MLLYVHRDHKDYNQDGHLDFHTVPELCSGVGIVSGYKRQTRARAGPDI